MATTCTSCGAQLPDTDGDLAVDVDTGSDFGTRQLPFPSMRSWPRADPALTYNEAAPADADTT